MILLGQLIVLCMTFIINLIVAQVMLSFFPQITILPAEYRFFIEAMMLMLVMVGISFTPVARALFRWSHHFILPPEDELARLQRILKPILLQAGKNRSDFRVYIAEQNILNAYASGVNEIAVTRPLLSLSDYELQGILAHEIGHLHYKDGIILNVINTMNLITIVSFKILTLVNAILCAFTRIPIIGIAAAIASWTIVLFSYMIAFLAVFPQKMGIILSRYQEERVDAYAARLGFGENLIAGLVRIDTTDTPSLWARITSFLSATHPSTHDRIKRIQHILSIRDSCR